MQKKTLLYTGNKSLALGHNYRSCQNEMAKKARLMGGENGKHRDNRQASGEAQHPEGGVGCSTSCGF